MVECWLETPVVLVRGRLSAPILKMKKVCPHCNREFSKYGIGTHIWKVHGDGKNHNPNRGYIDGTRTVWNKGLTKESHASLQSTSDTMKKNGGRPHSEETKQKLSEKQKLAHKEGRAWNIGMSRWNNKPSYPETFFMKVIENEFYDNEYKQEFRMGIYSIDFAWEHIKHAIEIDGKQHDEDPKQIERDLRKNQLLKENGWKLLRIKWKDMYNDPKHWISIAKEFIDGVSYNGIMADS